MKPIPEPKRPRLLVLASTYPRWLNDPEPGFVHELSKRLAETFDVTVLCPHAPGALVREQLEGVSVVRYRYAPARWETLVNDGGIVTNLRRSRWKLLLVPGFIAAQAWCAWRLVRRERIQVIHAHWLIPQGLIAALQAKLQDPPTPFVVTSHGADLYALRGRLLGSVKRWVLSRATSATVVSSAMKDNLMAMGADTRKVTVVPMGVDVLQRFTPDVSAVRLRDEILFVGRLVEKKGLIHLLRAMPDILETRPSTYLTIAGFGPDEPRLRLAVDELGLGASVHFMGALPQSELPALYRRAALFVAPFVRAPSGDQEGLPVALMEAIACGCPVLAGDVAGLADLLGENAGDVLVDPHDKGRLAQRVIERLANADAAQARALQMGIDVRERFDWKHIAERYAGLLHAACQTSEP